MAKINEVFGPEVSRIGSSILQLSDVTLSHALEATEELLPGEGSSKILVAVMSMAPALQFIAGAIAENGPNGDRVEMIDKELMLIAALIAGRTCQAKGAMGRIEYSSRNILAAVEAANKVAGRDLTQYCNSEMLKTFREGLAQSGTPELGYWDYLDNTGPQFEGGFNTMASTSRH